MERARRRATTPSRSSTRCCSYSRYAVPHALLVDVAETMARYGRLRLEKHPIHGLVLASTDRPVLEEVLRAKKIAGMLGDRIDDDTVVVHPSERGNLKQALLKLGWPAEDFAGYVDGEAHPIALDRGRVDAARLPARGGRVVLARRLRASSCSPAAPARRMVGAAAMAQAQATTLILVTNTVAARQWKDELVRRTSLTEDEIGEYSGVGQGDPAGHHRDVPGDDDAPEGRLRATSSCSTPATGA